MWMFVASVTETQDVRLRADVDATGAVQSSSVSLPQPLSTLGLGLDP